MIKFPNARILYNVAGFILYMFKGKKVSLVFPAYNEEKNIGRAIDEFRRINVFDEIIVVDNNSKDQTAKIAKSKGATVIKEINQGYGFALRRGMKEVKGDYIVLSEPDGTFVAKDAFKLLPYINQHDMVTGTRTNPEYFTKDANMGFFLQFGNIAVAKLMQFLYHTSFLSDCGCTFRVLRKSLVKKLLPRFTVGGQHFLSELVVVTALLRGSILETPVRYQKRVGRSKITGSLTTSIKVGLRMVGVILNYKLFGENRFFK